MGFRKMSISRFSKNLALSGERKGKATEGQSPALSIRKRRAMTAMAYGKTTARDSLAANGAR